MSRWLGGLAAAQMFLACILVANYLTTEHGMVPVGFGLAATAGTYLAGLTFVLRDLVQEWWNHWIVFALIFFGAILSFLIAAPAIAIASGVAFLVSELLDFAVYTPLRERGFLRAAVASNLVGSFVDTVLFLWIAGFPVWSAVPGQMVAKMTVTLAFVAGVMALREVLRNSLVRSDS